MSNDLTPIEKAFVEQLTTRKLVEKGSSVLAAVSGGPDSMALMHLLQSARPVLHFSLEIAHCHFGLRDRESDLDESLVAEEAARLGLRCHIRHFDTRRDAGSWKKSIEETARIERYGFFSELQRTCGFDRVATGHHVNDNAETILFNLFRGTSVPGLKGIRAHHGTLIRPMLLMRREDVMSYIDAKNIAYRTDASNFGIEPDRNFIRHRVIPVIEERFQHKLLPSLRRISEQAGELEEFLELHFEKLQQENDGLRLCDDCLRVSDLARLTTFERKELFKRALQELCIEPSSKVIDSLCALLGTQPGRRIRISGGVEAVWKGKLICFHPPAKSDTEKG
ncbi:MAG: tRNA lysidine(34) synthetase TilS [Prosthecochloris sp.]|uniref:tRNA lysidine(34) synthetase TilS n=1 Tax=Prosthecochloris sp. TaxID=290513 RepID=UPI00258B00FB|nr:tRNA lysidine(34) synthetase TilS [Prosthecochloris sp.]MCW8799052.1 tRNA lysidine(34) synthetase TilS [Prosthecochloris sp.]